MLPWLLCGAIFLLLLIVCLRLWSLRRALGELAGQLSYVLSEEMCIRDRYFCGHGSLCHASFRHMLGSSSYSMIVSP